MAKVKINDQTITDNYALYHGDCIDVMSGMADSSVGLSVYSPPFCGLYHYSSSERDLSNARNYEEFFEHYSYVVRELFRITMPGRMTAVHCMDVPDGNTGCDHLIDFPGDIIRMHERIGFKFAGRYFVWKEPLTVRNRTMAKNLAHKSIVDDSSRCTNAGADQMIVFRRKGKNTVPIEHPTGLHEYIGARRMPEELRQYRGHKGKQTENRFSHWIWRQYASSFWDDVRLDRVLPYRPARDKDDLKHVHPLQLDVIERTVTLWSNPGEVVFTPFMGVGSEVYGAVRLGRLGAGAELKETYYNQAVKNVADAVGKRLAGNGQLELDVS